MCGVAKSATASKARLMSGSFFQTSRTRRSRRGRAVSSAFSSTTSPREALMKDAPDFMAAKKAASAKSRFSGQSGMCNVTMSETASNSGSGVKAAGPSTASRGGSLSNTRRPARTAASATSEPTCPTPTMPSVAPGRSRDKARKAAITYCATAAALQPGAETTAIP